jgi:hypothetical protein
MVNIVEEYRYFMWSNTRYIKVTEGDYVSYYYALPSGNVRISEDEYYADLVASGEVETID